VVVKRGLFLWTACLLACTAGTPSSQDTVRKRRPLEHVKEDVLDLDYDRGQMPLGEPSRVVLDPLGEAALVIDTAGGMQLWPALATETPCDRETWPINLPFPAPRLVSFARNGDAHPYHPYGSFLLATIDTDKTLEVIEVRLMHDKVWSGVHVVRRFALPAADPILEAYVLLGGERIVVLGEDRRIRLYDDHGLLVSQLSQPGFMPEQLRVGSNGMVAVLTEPSRVQPVVVAYTLLHLDGEARTVALDGEPNPTDLALSPDGRTVAALRRAAEHSGEWNIEITDLASDERKRISVTLDVPIRPRMHYVDDARLLLDSGDGKGHWIELAKAEHTPKVVPLAGAGESTTASGIRAAIDPETGVLVVDPLDDPHHLELGYRSASYDEVAVNVNGTWIALVDHQDGQNDELLIIADFYRDPEEEIRAGPTVLSILGTIVEFDFVAYRELLAVVRGPADQPMTVQLFAEDGQWGRTAILPLPIRSDAKATLHIWNGDLDITFVGIAHEDQRSWVQVDREKKTLTIVKPGPEEDEFEWPELRPAVPEASRWAASVPGEIDAVELSPSGQIVAARFHPRSTETDDAAGWVFFDAKTGTRMSSTQVSNRVGLAWKNDNYIGEARVAHDHALLSSEHAFEIIDPRTGERDGIAHGLGPAWRWVSDEQAPRPFTAEHLNTQGLTIRPTGN
jgi:hypothetical protein